MAQPPPATSPERVPRSASLPPPDHKRLSGIEIVTNAGSGKFTKGKETPLKLIVEGDGKSILIVPKGRGKQAAARFRIGKLYQDHILAGLGVTLYVRNTSGNRVKRSTMSP